MNTENGVDREARTTEWIAICIALAVVIYKFVVPSQTDTLPITSWDATMANRPLVWGFVAVCASFIAVGASVGYHGLSWNFAKAPLNYRMLMLAIATLPLPIVFWIQQKFHFIAGEPVGGEFLNHAAMGV